MIFQCFFYLATIAFNVFWWLGTIGQTIVVVYVSHLLEETQTIKLEAKPTQNFIALKGLYQSQYKYTMIQHTYSNLKAKRERAVWWSKSIPTKTLIGVIPICRNIASQKIVKVGLINDHKIRIIAISSTAWRFHDDQCQVKDLLGESTLPASSGIDGAESRVR